MPYPSLSDLKSYLSEPVLETRHDASMGGSLASAVAKVEAYTDRYFGQTEEPSELDFVPSTRLRVSARDFYGSPTVSVDSDLDGTFATTLGGGEWVTGPSDQRAGYPSYEIRLVSGVFPVPVGGRPTVRVDAQWGWESTPPEVFSSVLELAAEIWKRRDAPFGIAGFDQLGAVIRVSASDVRVLSKIEYLRRFPVLVG